MPYDLSQAYNPQFFIDNIIDSQPMADYLAPEVERLLQVNSAVDFGAGSGHWVRALSHTSSIIGIEGSPNAQDKLLCRRDLVYCRDLRYPLNLQEFPERFQAGIDLAVSIEVAEHLEAEFAPTYVNNIVLFKPKYVLMTAAPPGQGGEHHVNEQPKQYWIDLFAKVGYLPDQLIVDQISQIVEAGRKMKDVPARFKHQSLQHEGVWIPYWMPKNLLVFRRAV